MGRFHLFASVALAALLFSGCNYASPLQKAKGQVLVDGKNYQVGAREQLLVIFYPVVEGGQPRNTYPANVNQDGSFETAGMDGKGIPPGKYHVSVSSPYGGGAVPIPKALDSHESPIVREIVLGKDTLEPIDISKPAG
jgi:hypothetical protein